MYADASVDNIYSYHIFRQNNRFHIPLLKNLTRAKQIEYNAIYNENFTS